MSPSGSRAAAAPGTPRARYSAAMRAGDCGSGLSMTMSRTTAAAPSARTRSTSSASRLRGQGQAPLRRIVSSSMATITAGASAAAPRSRGARRCSVSHQTVRQGGPSSADQSGSARPIVRSARPTRREGRPSSASARPAGAIIPTPAAADPSGTMLDEIAASADPLPILPLSGGGDRQFPALFRRGNASAKSGRAWAG